MTRLIITQAAAAEAGRGIARLDPADMAVLGLAPGALLALTGARTTHVRALPRRGQPGHVALDGATRGNLGLGLGDAVAARAAPDAAIATRLALAGGRMPDAAIRRALDGVPLQVGDTHRIPLVGGREASLRVAAITPPGPALLGAASEITFDKDNAAPPAQGIRYDEIGGLSRVLDRVREVVELPLRNRAAFEALGIAPPRGVLLCGPPGTGKTLIARAVATETGAHFIAINGPEIIDKYYGASEQQLRAIFAEAQKHAPAIIFIDELDAIAPKREALSGDKQVERRIVAQLLTLMDGLSGRGDVVVLAATNLPDSLDPALRRPGRFDREIRIDPPDRLGRREILAVHSRAMPLGPDVDLDALAGATPGHVGADLAALCREAAMAALRREGALSAAGLAKPPAEIVVTAADFAAAQRLVVASVLRESFVEIPDLRWSDVAGIGVAREALRRAVEWPLRRPQAFARLGLRPPRGVLLHGAPGTGKTLAARALASESGCAFIAIRGAEMLSEWQGASEAALRKAFARARAAAPCILFFDEIDAIAGRRGGGDGATVERMVAQLLVEMDGVADPPGVVVLGATNRLDRIDPALLRPGRFDLVVEMPLPDLAARRAILAVHVARMPLAPDVDCAALAAATEGFVGADLAGLCRRAGLEALARVGEDEEPDTVQAQDFNIALKAQQEARRWISA